MKKEVKAGIGYVFSAFFLKGISILTVPVFTRLMTEAEVGQFSAMATWISVLSPIFTMNLCNSVLLAKYDFKNEFNSFIKSISVLSIISVLCWYCLSTLNINFIEKSTKLPSYAINLLFIYIFSSSIFDIFILKLRANLNYKPIVVITILSALISTGVALLLVFCFEDKFWARAVGTYIPLCLFGIVIFFYLLTKGRRIKWSYCKYALVICIPLAVHGLAGNIMHFSDRIMIQHLCNDESLALYSVAYTCGMTINMIRNSIQAAWDPWLFEKIRKNHIAIIRRASCVYAVGFAFLCIGVVIMAPEIMLFLGGENYREACYVIPPVVEAYYVYMIYSLYSGVERYYKKQKWFAFFAVFSAMCNIILNYFCIPYYGYVAAAYTTLICAGIECALHYGYSLIKGYTKYYYNRFNVVAVLVMVLLSTVIVHYYDCLFVRIVLLGVLLFGGGIVAYNLFYKRVLEW